MKIVHFGSLSALCESPLNLSIYELFIRRSSKALIENRRNNSKISLKANQSFANYEGIHRPSLSRKVMDRVEVPSQGHKS